MPAPTPPVIPQPFAEGGTRNAIPDTTASIQHASYELGYPPATMTPIDAGGVPMLGPDMNGILWAVTSWLYALQGGQIQPYDSDTSDAIGGYALGALVLMADGAGYWISTTAGNTTDPDAGGSGWQPVYAYGATAITGLTGGARTLSAVESSRYFLVLTGALVAPQQIVVPNAYRNYLVVNATTGGQTLTVKTASGSGVAVPAGGAASPTAVWCDTINVNPVFVPSALPTSVEPTADSIVLRDNLGRQFGLTAAVGTRTTQVASTAFANPAGVPSAGWRQNADGTIEQWGTGSGTGANRTVTLPTAYLNGAYNIQLTPRRTSGDALGQMPTIVGTPATTSFVYAPPDGSSAVDWRTIGLPPASP
jgi:hypothetical protein